MSTPQTSDRRTFAVLLAAAVLGLAFVASGGETVPAAQAKQLVSDGALLVDVRSPGEFESGHIDGAINVPVDQVDAKHPAFADKQRKIVVYCRSGGRSSRAKKVLDKAGYTVFDLGGMGNWK